MIADGRPLSTRIKVLADREAARAVGIRKQIAAYDQTATNCERDASWLNEAAEFIRRAGK